MENSNFTFINNFDQIKFALIKLNVKMATNGTQNHFENLIAFNANFSNSTIYLIPKEDLKLKFGITWNYQKTEEFNSIISENPTELNIDDLYDIDIDFELTSKLENKLFENNVIDLDLRFLYILELLVNEDIKLKFPKLY